MAVARLAPSPDHAFDCLSKIFRKFCHLLLWSARQQLLTLLGVLSSLCKTSVELRLENLALRHQHGVLRRSAPKRLQLRPADRILWVGYAVSVRTGNRPW
jgi:hypothetical protein